MDRQISPAIDRMEQPVRKGRIWQLVIVLALAVVLWAVLRGPGTDTDGLKAAWLLETGPRLRSFSDHLLWHELSWITFSLGKQIDPTMRGIPAQQIVNLALFCLSLLALWRYLGSKGKSFWLTGLGMLASYTTFKSLIGEDVDVGPVLMTTLLLFILPNSNIKRRTLWAILILALGLVFHKSLALIMVGWWLVELIWGDGLFRRRIVRASLVVVVSLSLSLIFNYCSWYFLTDNPDFMSWFFPHGENTTQFFSLGIFVILKGFALVCYRSFFSITPVKLLAEGNWWGIIGIILITITSLMMIYLVVKSIWNKKDGIINAEFINKDVRIILIALLPSLLFFLFWIPGYYTYWSRFLPAFWVMLELRLPHPKFVNWLKWICITMLLSINAPFQLSVKNGEEAGRFSKWLAPKLTAGDYAILPGNGVFFFGIMLTYYYNVNTITTDTLQIMDDASAFLQEKACETWKQGHKVWFIMDYPKWNSESIIQGKQVIYTKGMDAVSLVFKLGPKQEFADPAMREAWIAECLPRQ